MGKMRGCGLLLAVKVTKVNCANPRTIANPNTNPITKTREGRSCHSNMLHFLDHVTRSKMNVSMPFI